MRDTQIAYGANSVRLDSAKSARVLRKSARKFMASHRQTVTPEADFTWILGPSDSADEALDGIDPVDELDRLASLGFNKHTARGRNNPDDALPSRSGHYDCPEKHDCRLDTRYDMGSLQMLRGAAFRAYFDHLDADGTFLHHHIPDSTVKSLGASLLLPTARIWRMDEVVCTPAGRAYCLPPDDPPAVVDRHRRRFLAATLGGGAFGWDDATLETQAPDIWRQYWAQVAEYLDYLQPLTDSGRGHTSLDWGTVPAKVVWMSCKGMIARYLVGDVVLRVLFSERVLYYLLGIDAGITCDVTVLKDDEEGKVVRAEE